MDKLKKILKSELGLLLVLALLCVVFAVASPHFLKQQNLLNITRQVSIVLIVSMGMLGVVLTGEIDLSVGSSAALAGVALAYVMSKTGSIWLGIMAALGLGLVMGLDVYKRQCRSWKKRDCPQYFWKCQKRDRRNVL